VKLPEKIEIFRKFGLKNRHFFTRIHDPQISNRIDAAAYVHGCLHYYVCVYLCMYVSMHVGIKYNMYVNMHLCFMYV